MPHRAPAADRGPWWWLGGLILVPTLLAGVAALWPGPQLSDGLRLRAQAALEAAGLDGVTVAMSGRDATLAGVPPAAQTAAVGAVAAVDGVRTARVAGLLAPDDGRSGQEAVGAPGAQPPATGRSAAAGRQLADRLAAAHGAAPITFDADSAELGEQAAAAVALAADALRAVPDVPVVLEGHTADTPGPVEVAQRLSERRAEVVAAALVAAGIDRGRISTAGRGGAQPLATPAASRRVEITIP